MKFKSTHSIILVLQLVATILLYQNVAVAQLKVDVINDKIKDDLKPQLEPLNGSLQRPVKEVEVQANAFVPKDPEDLPGNALSPISIEKPSKKEILKSNSSLKNQVDRLNMVPLPLVASPEEALSKLDKQREVEQEQLTSLWEATLARSIDVNFVLHKLMPTTEKNKSTTVMMKMLSTLMYAGMGGLNLFAPGPTGRITQTVGVNLLSNLMNFRESKKDKLAHVTQTEQILLFGMVRNLADNLVEKYRNYKKEWKSHIGAKQDLRALKAMVADARVGQSVSEQIKMEYYLRKQRRDIQAAFDQLEMNRQALIDLAGPKAVFELEKKFEEEFKYLYPEVLN